MRAKEFLIERYLNLFLDDTRLREKYKQEVWDILQTSYKSAGGYKGTGVYGPDDLVDQISMWKLAKKNNRIVAVSLYKDKGGRKLVAAGTDGSQEGKAALKNMSLTEPSRSYGEKSKSSLGFFLKSVPNAKDYLIPFEEAQKVSKDEIIPVTGDWPDLSDEELKSTIQSLKKYPFLSDYGYFRRLRDEWVFKIMYGTSGLTITRT